MGFFGGGFFLDCWGGGVVFGVLVVFVCVFVVVFVCVLVFVVFGFVFCCGVCLLWVGLRR